MRKSPISPFLSLGLLVGALGLFSGEAAAQDRRLANLSPAQIKSGLPGGGLTSAPIGFVRFCADHAEDCGPNLQPVPQIALDERRAKELERVNRAVNEAVEPVTDLDHYGETERWAYPDDGKGDCEDYVLEKRRQLIRLGWPSSVLLITVVRDREGDGHAVLTVVSDRGDLILDNQTPDIITWQETGYRFVKRQSQVDAGKWVSLGDMRGSPVVVGGGR